MDSEYPERGWTDTHPKVFQDAWFRRDEGVVRSRPCPIGRRPRCYRNVVDIRRIVPVWKNISEVSAAILIRQYRASDPLERKKYVALVERVQRKGGEVLRFSSMHESGQRKPDAPSTLQLEIDVFQELNQLTGIAAILTFPLDVEVVEMEEREAREQESGEVDERMDGDVAPAGT